jgi:hypothetical protein
MGSINPSVNFNLKFSDSFWIRLACALAGHSYKDQYVTSRFLPDGSLVMTPQPVCNRCGKFKNFPFYWKDYWKKPGMFMRA